MVNIHHYLPSKDKLVNSFHHRSREFLRENTLHGVPYFVNPRRPLWDRIFWFIATMAAIISTIFISITIYNRFQSKPILTRLDIETEELIVDFPSLTLCPVKQTLDFGRYKDDSEHYNMMHSWLWHDIKGKEPKMALSGETYSEFFYRISPECEDLYENCSYMGKKVPCAEMFKKRIFSRGVCCFVESTKMTQETGPRDVTFDAKVFPFSLDLLSKYDVPPKRYTAITYMLKTGTRLRADVKFTYSTPDVEALRKSQRECLFPEEDLSYGMCIRNCMRKRATKACRCWPWFMMSDNSGIECTLPQYSCIRENVSTNFFDCNCYLSCNHTSYNLEQVDMYKNNNIIITIPNWPGSAYSRDIRFGWLDLVVSFGGIAGSFFGYSLLTTVEFLYYMVLRTYCGAVLDGSQITINRNKKKLKKIPRRRVINVVDFKGYHDYIE